MHRNQRERGEGTSPRLGCRRMKTRWRSGGRALEFHRGSATGKLRAWGRHGGAPRVTAKKRLATARAHASRSCSCAWSEAMRTSASSGAVALDDFLRDKKGERAQGTRSNAGRRESKRGAAGAHGDGRNSRNTAAEPATPTSDFSGCVTKWNRGKGGKGGGGPGLYSHALRQEVNRLKREESRGENHGQLPKEDEQMRSW